MTLVTADQTARRQQGLTLVAALTALLIMSIGMTALFRLYIDTRLNSQHAARSATALGLARDKLEQLRFDVNSASTGSDSDTINTTTYTRHWQASDNPLLHTRQIDVTLRWSDNSGNFAISLTTTIDTLAITVWPPSTR